MKICYILQKHLHHFEIFFDLNKNFNKKNKTKSLEQQIKNHFKDKVEEWRKSMILTKRIICKICLQMFVFDNINHMEFHFAKCKETAELNQLLGQLSKKMKKFQTECEIIKRELQLETNIEK